MPNPVKAVPERYHSLTPNLVVQNAAGAIDFYKKAFGATEIERFPGPDGKVMHAELKIGDSIIFVNDAMGPVVLRLLAPAIRCICTCMFRTRTRFSTGLQTREPA